MLSRLRPARDAAHRVRPPGHGVWERRCRGRRPPGGERGSVTVFTAVFAIAVVFLLALILDGGMAMNARQRAADIAGQAARAAAADLDIAAVRAGHPQIAGDACAVVVPKFVSTYAAADSGGVDRVLSAQLAGCSGPGGITATVAVTITTQPLVPGVLGSFTMTATQSATIQCGIAQREAC
jgi:Flp pilus assembly protein TadG